MTGHWGITLSDSPNADRNIKQIRSIELTGRAQSCDPIGRMHDIDHKIEARVRGFIAELSALVRQAALVAVEAALTERATKKSSAQAGPAAKSTRRTGRAVARKHGEKRSQGELQRLTERLHAYIRANKGEGIEAIGRGLAVETRELSLPIKKLLASKRIGARGQKRATRYFSR